MPDKSQWPRTGLVCISCREPVAYVEHTTSRGLHIHCPACLHTWIAEDVPRACSTSVPISWGGPTRALVGATVRRQSSRESAGSRH